MTCNQRAARAVACFLVLGFVAAQVPEAAPNARAPVVRVDLLGPAAWRARFLPTNLGSMFASAEGEKLLRPLIAEFDAIWRRVPVADEAAARARFLAFGGSVTFAIWPVGTASGNTPPPVIGVLAVAGEGAAPMAADLARWLELLPEREELEIAGRMFTVARTAHFACTLPQTIAGRAVVLMADQATGLAAAAAQSQAFLEGAPAAPAAPLRIAVDIAQSIAVQGSWKDEPMFAALGLGSLAEFVVTLGADGPSVRTDFELRFQPGERGLFAGFFPERTGVPTLGDLVPPAATGWKVGRFDLAALWRAGVRAAAAGGDRTEDEVVERAKTECNGVDPGKDLFAHLRDEVVVLWQDDSTGAETGARRVSMCLAMPALDEKAVAAAVTKLLAASDLELTEVDGVLRVTQPEGWLFPAIHLAVGRGLALLAVGDAGDDQIDAILTRAKGRTPAPPEGSDLWRRRAPPGWNSAGRMGLDSFLRYHLGMFVDGLDEVSRFIPLDDKDLADGAASWRPLLEKHDLMHVALLTGCAEGRWCLRVLW